MFSKDDITVSMKIRLNHAYACVQKMPENTAHLLNKYEKFTSKLWPNCKVVLPDLCVKLLKITIPK